MIRLLSTDFDGTLVDHFASPAVSPRLFEMFGALRRCGVLWAVNTGRGLQLTLDGLSEFGFPMDPDYILTNEREVFHRDSRGEWQDYGDWNRRCNAAHDYLFETEAGFVNEMVCYLNKTDGVDAIWENGKPVGVVTKNDSMMEEVVSFLHSIKTPDSLFHYQRNTIFLRFCHAHYSKGTVLGELQRLLEISVEETFAAGDHHNDLSMLDGIYAKWTLATGNAITEVKETVTKAGGFVADKRCSEGVLQGLDYFFKEHKQAPPNLKL
jgi:HAD superfamily hydrolase (TIGR01484 family)